MPFRDSTLEKWSNKVQAASGMRLNKKFKAFDQVTNRRYELYVEQELLITSFYRMS